MVEFLYSIDKAVFVFCNQTIANPVCDAFMPVLTDLNQHWYGLLLFAGAWLLLFVRGGKRGRTVALLLLPLIAMTDQLSSNLIKHVFARSRPCHEANGLPIVEHVHLLVNCGSGYSFPSSHAVNNFAAGCYLSYYYRKWTWAFLSYASLVGFSRMSVGVHYPSDVLGGALIGCACAAAFIVLWNALEKELPAISISDNPPTSSGDA